MITYLLQDASIQYLYEEKMNVYNTFYHISDDIEKEWNNLKFIIAKAADEAIDHTRGNICHHRIKIWNDNSRKAVEMNNQAYNKYLVNKINENSREQSRLSNIVRARTRKALQDNWDSYIADIKNYIHGR